MQDFGVLGRTSLTSILRWNFKANMEKLMSSLDKGQIALVISSVQNSKKKFPFLLPSIIFTFTNQAFLMDLFTWLTFSFYWIFYVTMHNITSKYFMFHHCRWMDVNMPLYLYSHLKMISGPSLSITHSTYTLWVSDHASLALNISWISILFYSWYLNF